ncbi:hypothetical protein [Ekhidna sp.]|uniref:glycoside hydrolase family 113 n=1 Tax=Ekhidna sp. TaxID=2608089 RepID=UPI0032EB4C38
MRLFVLLLFLVFGGVAMVLLPANKEVRIHGASLVNPPREITVDKMGEVKRINAKWVALIPYAFSRDGEPQVSFDHSRQWWGEHTDGNCTLIQYAKNNGLKVMVKPHVWARGAGWVGDFDLDSEENWKIWESDYTKYILNHAVKADSMNVELFCIGTEYRIPSKERPEFWRSLIRQVREVYKGKITYAANWDNYENITWWDAVDYIGIDAYFPLASGAHPNIEEIKKGWDPIKKNLSAFSEKWNKPILFTEYGFQSANGAAGNHWEVDESEENANHQLQADAYEATFQAFENEKWWAGGFFWKWHFTSRYGKWRGTEWTPQNKPAEKVIARWYGKQTK